jgi:hypothetical protein
VLKPAVAGILALLLIVAATLAVSHSLHRALHPGATENHLCLICSLVKGEVGTADVSAIFALFVCALWFFHPHFTFVVPIVIDQRLDRSRAPPR